MYTETPHSKGLDLKVFGDLGLQWFGTSNRNTFLIVFKTDFAQFCSHLTSKIMRRDADAAFEQETQ